MLSESALCRILNSKDYSIFITHYKESKSIEFKSITNDKIKQFVILEQYEIDYLLSYKNITKTGKIKEDNLFCMYYIYLKYYCSYAVSTNTRQDFTAS